MVLVQRGAAFAGLGCQTCPVGWDGSSTGSNAGGDTPVVLPLDDPAAGLEQVGGKGASLARLAAAGLPASTSQRTGCRRRSSRRWLASSATRTNATARWPPYPTSSAAP